MTRAVGGVGGAHLHLAARTAAGQGRTEGVGIADGGGPKPREDAGVGELNVLVHHGQRGEHVFAPSLLLDETRLRGRALGQAEPGGEHPRVVAAPAPRDLAGEGQRRLGLAQVGSHHRILRIDPRRAPEGLGSGRDAPLGEDFVAGCELRVDARAEAREERADRGGRPAAPVAGMRRQRRLHGLQGQHLLERPGRDLALAALGAARVVHQRASPGGPGVRGSGLLHCGAQPRHSEAPILDGVAAVDAVHPQREHRPR